jgi:hypothetical protein
MSLSLDDEENITLTIGGERFRNKEDGTESHPGKFLLGTHICGRTI